MKIRLKSGMGSWEVVEESPSYYLIQRKGLHVFDWPTPPVFYGELLALPKSEYEPVPEAKWRNVTGEVEIRSGDGRGSQYAIYHNGHWVNCTVVEGYRFVKQSLWMALTLIENTEEQKMKDQFIITVEHKESV